MSSELVDDAIKAFYDELEQLSGIYEELMDTDVRESLHMVLNFFFVWGKASDKQPISYGMFSREGDKALADSVNKFLDSVLLLPELKNFHLGQERLNLIQNPKIATTGGYRYDDFIGHASKPLSPEELPEDLFEEDTYDD